MRFIFDVIIYKIKNNSDPKYKFPHESCIQMYIIELFKDLQKQKFDKQIFFIISTPGINIRQK